MFIDVTRYGGMRTLRVAATAVAFLDAIDSGSALHLIGGETLRVNEDPDVIEARVVAALTPPPPPADETAPPDEASEAVGTGEGAPAAELPPAPPAPPAPRKRR